MLVVMEHPSRRIVHINGTWRNQPPVGWSRGLLLFLLTLLDNVDIRSRRWASAQNSLVKDNRSRAGQPCGPGIAGGVDLSGESRGAVARPFGRSHLQSWAQSLDPNLVWLGHRRLTHSTWYIARAAQPKRFGNENRARTGSFTRGLTIKVVAPVSSLKLRNVAASTCASSPPSL